MSDRDNEANRFTARARRYAQVGTNMSGVAARFAAARMFGVGLDRERNAAELTAALGGLDTLVFTGGIGENAPAIRASVCRAAKWLGVIMDEAANDSGRRRISVPASQVSVWVLPTDEILAKVENLAAEERKASALKAAVVTIANGKKLHRNETHEHFVSRLRRRVFHLKRHA